jgi:hypothetical protein
MPRSKLPHSTLFKLMGLHILLRLTYPPSSKFLDRLSGDGDAREKFRSAIGSGTARPSLLKVR